MSSNYGCPGSRGVGGRGHVGQAGGRTRPPKWPGIYVIGLTGGIASGKSTVSNMLADLGAVIIDADWLAREVTLPGSEGLRRIREAFGDSVVTPEGVLDRHRLAEIIFHDDDARAKLNSIIHPLVMERVKQLLRETQDAARREGCLMVGIVDAPLLFEAGADAICDETWVVAVDREGQAKRLMRREGYTREEASSRIDSQMPLDEKERRATRIIDNQGTVEETRKRVLELWESVPGVSART
jgi:dephospho-CoA kinase